MSNDLIMTVDEEPDGEGWFECRICGLHVGYANRDEAERDAEMHTTSDCVDELEFA